jgi:hypothetical protein
MKKVVLLFVAVYIGLISDIVPLVSATDSSKGFAFTDKVVLAYYYIWFNELAEFSHIEATFEHGYTYIDLTAEFVRKFKSRK